MTRYLILPGVLVLVGAAWAAGAGGRGTGFLKVDTPGLVVKLAAGKSFVVGKEKEVPVPCGRAVPLPAGSYKVSSVTLFAKDKAGKLWSLQSAGRRGKLAKFDIAEGETTTLQGGGPLRVSVRVKVLKGSDLTYDDFSIEDGPIGRLERDARYVLVVVRYVGQAGEEYSPFVKIGKRIEGYSPFVKMGKRILPFPAICILDENGSSVIEGPYMPAGVRGATVGASGVGSREGFLRPLFAGFPERIRVKVIQDLGPFEIEPEKKPKLHSVIPNGKGPKPPPEKGP